MKENGYKKDGPKKLHSHIPPLTEDDVILEELLIVRNKKSPNKEIEN